jgi:hypothetical protein
MTDLEKKIFQNKLSNIQKYIDLGHFPIDFVWNDDEYTDRPYRLELLKWFKENTEFERTIYGVRVNRKL